MDYKWLQQPQVTTSQIVGFPWNDSGRIFVLARLSPAVYVWRTDHIAPPPMAATATPSPPATGRLLPLTARFSPDLLSRLDVQAKRIQTTRGALLRALAARGLEAMDQPAA